jgi:hypothetical protein
VGYAEMRKIAGRVMQEYLEGRKGRKSKKKHNFILNSFEFSKQTKRL